MLRVYPNFGPLNATLKTLLNINASPKGQRCLMRFAGGMPIDATSFKDGFDEVYRVDQNQRSEA